MTGTNISAESSNHGSHKISVNQNSGKIPIKENASLFIEAQKVSVSSSYKKEGHKKRYPQNQECSDVHKWLFG